MASNQCKELFWKGCIFCEILSACVSCQRWFIMMKLVRLVIEMLEGLFLALDTETVRLLQSHDSEVEAWGFPLCSPRPTPRLNDLQKMVNSLSSWEIHYFWVPKRLTHTDKVSARLPWAFYKWLCWKCSLSKFDQCLFVCSLRGI